MCGVFPWLCWWHGRSIFVYTMSWHWELSAHVTLKHVFDLVCHCQSKRTLRVVQKFKPLSRKKKQKISAILATFCFLSVSVPHLLELLYSVPVPVVASVCLSCLQFASLPSVDIFTNQNDGQSVQSCLHFHASRIIKCNTT